MDWGERSGKGICGVMRGRRIWGGEGLMRLCLTRFVYISDSPYRITLFIRYVETFGAHIW